MFAVNSKTGVWLTKMHATGTAERNEEAMSILHMIRERVSAGKINYIRWDDATSETVVWQFPTKGKKIRYGAGLLVKKGQAAVFLNGSQLCDVRFEGSYRLTEVTLPVLSTLQDWKYGNYRSFRAEVFFVSMRQFIGMPWWLSNAIEVYDREFGLIEIRARGECNFRVNENPSLLIYNLVRDNVGISAGKTNRFVL